MPFVLDDDQLRAAWQRHAQSTVHEGWRTRYRAHLQAIADAPRADLTTRAWQERLWRDKSITPVGPGDAVNVTALYEDAEIVDRVVDLRSMQLPHDAEQRARAIQGAYNELLGLVATRNVRVKPAAKLLRIFAGMLPHELTCVLSYEPNLAAAELVLGPQRRAHLELHVLMRQRLRNVLGPEQGGLAEEVLRSTFCWWLYENRDALAHGGAEDATHEQSPEPSEAPPLVLWPFGKQWKGNAAIRNFDRHYRDIVQAAVAGVARDELVELIRTDEQYKHLQPQSVRTQVSLVKGLGLLEERDGLLRPSATGEELLEVDQPDVLVRLLIERVFGHAQLLRLLRESGGALAKADLVRGLQSIYPNWTTAFAPTALLAWADALGLVDQEEAGTWTLSDYGRGWAARLPAQLPAPPKEVAIALEEELNELFGPSTVAFPSFAEIHAEMQRDADSSRFVFERALVAALDSGWRLSDKKRFVILSGLSGTGKTAITGCYARAVCGLMAIDLNTHLATVPVSPDWRDPTGLFGYFNALHADPTFHVEPALRLLLRAHADSSRPYFLVLDEMNLARVERYFAPMLSAMETGRELVLHANESPVNAVPPSIPWPRNVYIAGTVNMDESTHPFSDKVLDRAVTLEFWEVDLPAFFARRDAKDRSAEVEELLLEIYQHLRPVRRHFGYRTAAEVLDFVAAMRVAGEPGGTDLAVFGKILPRLRGEHTPELEAALTGVEKLCTARELSRCRAKLQTMLAELRQTGMTRFWA